MKEDLKFCGADNIFLSESLIGRVDYIYRQSSRGLMTTANGFVVAKQGKVFDGRLPIGWMDAHTKALIALTKRHHKRVFAEEKELIRRQDISNAERFKEKERRAANKILRDALNQISYFTIPTLRTITTSVKL